MDKDFVYDVLLELTCLLDQVTKTHTCALIVLLLSINHVNQSATVLNLIGLVVFDGGVAWEINNIKLNVFIVSDGLTLNCDCW